jgi:hypothetical protein
MESDVVNNRVAEVAVLVAVGRQSNLVAASSSTDKIDRNISCRRTQKRNHQWVGRSLVLPVARTLVLRVLLVLRGP